MRVLTLTTTNPTLVLNANPKRSRLTIQMQATDVDSNNTGTIHIGFGFQPVATIGVSNQGEVLLQAGGFNEPSIGGKLDAKYKKQIWATSSKTTQTIVFDEEVE